MELTHHGNLVSHPHGGLLSCSDCLDQQYLRARGEKLAYGEDGSTDDPPCCEDRLRFAEPTCQNEKEEPESSQDTDAGHRSGEQG